jgi:hypothetical protein
MSSFHQNKLLQFIGCCMLLLLLTTCRAGRLETIPTTQSISPSEQVSALDPDTTASLSSLEKLDNHPFYVMHYYGSYDYAQTGAARSESAGFSCSLFASLGEMGDMLFGRNFDWEFSPALLLFTDPPDGYASVSMIDLTFLDIDPTSSLILDTLPLLELTALLTAPSMPFDGMNEYGLAVGMAAIPDEYLNDASYEASRPEIGSIGIIRQVLDHARDVDEAVEIFSQYNIDFIGGPPIHYLLADPSGKAVLIEFYQGRMSVLPNENPWHLVTNHLRAIAEGDGSCPRYHTLSDQLSKVNGKLNAQAAMHLLSEVKQDMTQWSSVYNMSNGDINVVIAGNYETSFSYHLNLLFP